MKSPKWNLEDNAPLTWSGVLFVGPKALEGPSVLTPISQEWAFFGDEISNKSWRYKLHYKNRWEGSIRGVWYTILEKNVGSASHDEFFDVGEKRGFPGTVRRRPRPVLHLQAFGASEMTPQFSGSLRVVAENLKFGFLMEEMWTFNCKRPYVLCYWPEKSK